MDFSAVTAGGGQLRFVLEGLRLSAFDALPPELMHVATSEYAPPSGAAIAHAPLRPGELRPRTCGAAVAPAPPRVIGIGPGSRADAESLAQQLGLAHSCADDCCVWAGGGGGGGGGLSSPGLGSPAIRPVALRSVALVVRHDEAEAEAAAAALLPGMHGVMSSLGYHAPPRHRYPGRNSELAEIYLRF
jgi:hypothetical protein